MKALSETFNLYLFSYTSVYTETELGNGQETPLATQVQNILNVKVNCIT